MKLLSQKQYADVLSSKMSSKEYVKVLSIITEGTILSYYRLTKDIILNYYMGKPYNHFKYSSYLKEETEK